MFLHDTADFTIEFSRPADRIRLHAVEWQETDTPAAASPQAIGFPAEGGRGRFTVNRWCGGAAVSSVPGRVDDLDWKIRAVGDLDGDDHPDLIWQHRGDGRVAAWLMHGTQQMRGIVIRQVPDTAWEIVGPR